MRYIAVLIATLICASVVCGQDARNAVSRDPNVSGNWSKLGPTVDGPRGFTLHGRGIRINSHGQYELSVRVTPTNQPAFVKRYDLPKTTAYVLQFATVDCDKKLVSMEKTEIYGPSDRAIEGKITGITPASQKEAVRPGSIGESLFRFVCVETTTLPMTKTQN